MKWSTDLWSLYDRHAPLVTVLVVALTLVAGAGLTRVWFSDDYREIFRTPSRDFQLLQELGEQFSSDRNEVVLLVEGDFESSADVAALGRLTAELATIEGVSRAFSPTSASGLLQQLVEVQDVDLRERLLSAVQSHPLLVGKLLTPDLRAALVILEIDEDYSQLAATESVLEAARQPVEAARNSGVEVYWTGLPLFRSEIVRSTQRDQVVFTTAGVVVGVAILWLVFRDLSLMTLVGVGPVVGTVWTVGAMGWLGEPINVVNNVVPVLLLVVGMTDSVHVVREFQRLRADGAGQRTAALHAIQRIGPACAITSLTTVIAFASLALAEFSVIRRFGLTCAGGLLLTFLAVVTTVPLLAGRSPLGRSTGRHSVGRRWTLSSLLPISVRRSRWLVGLAFVLLALSGLAAARLDVDYRYDEFLPDGSHALSGQRAVQDHFGGAFPLRVVVDWSGEVDSTDVLAVLSSVEGALARSTIAYSPISVLAPLRALVGVSVPIADFPDPEVVPASSRERFWRGDLRRALVSARAPGVGARSLRSSLDDLESTLKEIELQHPGFSLSLNGLLPVSARTSLQMIRALWVSLAIACAVIFVVLTLAVGSIRLGLVSVPVNLLPLGAVCFVLVATGRPLQFTTVTLLTVVLGIAVDDTIHLLVSFIRARAAGAAAAQAMRETMDTIGMSLVITTCLLLAGFGAVWLSEAPQMSLFGALACLALVVALLADLLLFPSLLLEFTPAGDRDVASQ